LIDHAREAQLVVVGSRGRGAVAGLLLGSTSQQLLHHALCPVAVVRPD
ncbi:universal stress protein, partial [Kibdelosporangium lantanae]